MGDVVERFRQALADGARPTQAFVNSGSAEVARWVAEAGYDSVLLDMEHGPLSLDTLAEAVAATRDLSFPVARVPVSTAANVRRAVAAGAAGVMCPDVRTAAQAAELVEACRADRPVMSILQIESREAIAALPGILAVPGLDALFPGPSDLSVDLGGPLGLFYDEPRIADPVRAILAAAHDAGVYVALPATTRHTSDLAWEWGADWVAVASDAAWVMTGAAAALDGVRQGAAAVAARGRRSG
jgi:2-keto-3-deoxy-L-rhamnonate aldolase RhmA